MTTSSKQTGQANLLSKFREAIFIGDSRKRRRMRNKKIKRRIK